MAGMLPSILALIPYISILSYFLFLVWVVLVNGERNRMLLALEAEEETFVDAARD